MKVGNFENHFLMICYEKWGYEGGNEWWSEEKGVSSYQHLVYGSIYVILRWNDWKRNFEFTTWKNPFANFG